MASNRIRLAAGGLTLGLLACSSSPTPPAPPPSERGSTLGQEVGDPIPQPAESSPTDSDRTVLSEENGFDLSREKAWIAEARGALEASDYSAARENVAQAAAALVERPDSERNEAWLGVVHEAGVAALSTQDLQTARLLYEQALVVGTKILASESTKLLMLQANLASTLRAQGEFQRARQLLECVIEVRTRTLPPEHLDLLTARLNLAATLDELGHIHEARLLTEEVLEVLTRTLPADHETLQTARGILAGILGDQGDYHAARTMRELVLETLERKLPPDHPKLQNARMNLAISLDALGDHPTARRLKEQVLEMFVRTFPPEHGNVQAARMNLATTLKSMGELSEARALFEEVVDVRERTLAPDHPHLQLARLNLANTLFDLGELSAARALQELVLSIRERTFPPDHPELLTVQGNLANTLAIQGELHAARALEERVLDSRIRTLRPDHPSLQRARLNSAATLFTLGDMEAASVLLEQVLEVRSNSLPEDHQDLQMVRMNVAIISFFRGDHVRARELLELVLEVRSRTLPPEHPHIQQTRLNLAVALAELGNLPEARAHLEEVLSVRMSQLPPGHRDLQSVRTSLALVLGLQGDLLAARALFEQALEVLSDSFPPDHPEIRQVLIGLADTQAVIAASIRGEAGDQERDEGWQRAADLHATLARATTASARHAMLSSSSREAEERCSGMTRALSSVISFAEGYGVFDSDPGIVQAAFALSETTRASALGAARLATLARHDERYIPLRSEIQAAGEELAHMAQSGATRDAFGAVVAKRDRAQRALVQLASESKDAAGLLMDPVPALLSARLAEDEALVAYRRYGHFEFRAGETKAHSTDSLCAFVIRRGGVLELLDLGATERIEAAVKGWRDALGIADGRGLPVVAPASRAPDDRAVAAQIRALVFDPLLPSLHGVRRLTIILDDVLQLVPIDALPAGELDGGAETDLRKSRSNALLGDLYKIEMRLTTQEILQPAPEAPRGAGLIVLLGGADYSAVPAIHSDDPEENPTASAQEAAAVQPAAVASLLRGGAWDHGFPPLPGTTAEARGLETLAGNRGNSQELVRLEGAVASRTSIEALAPRARFLHLATHGWFAPESIRSWSDPDPVDKQGNALARMSAEQRVKGSSPMVLCGLALAGANLPPDATGRYPGLVTAEEISGWDLSNSELAVLSACDTNVGERRAGQGVASLQKALHMAGARTVITSLWRVPDEATKELMLEFYRRIWVEKESKALALWKAKTRLRDAKDGRGAHRYAPRDWIGWVLTGDPN